MTASPEIVVKFHFIWNEGDTLPAYLERVEKFHLGRALHETGGRKKRAATLLGISFRQMRYLLEKYKITWEAPRYE